MQKFKPLVCFCSCTEWLMSEFVTNPEDRFCLDEAHLIGNKDLKTSVPKMSHPEHWKIIIQ